MANQNASWRQTSINVLLNGPTDPSEYEIAASLISEGYATGDYRPDYTTSTNRVAQVVWGGPTLKGLEYADCQQERLVRESFAYKLKIRTWNAMSFGAGCVFTALIQSLF